MTSHTGTKKSAERWQQEFDGVDNRDYFYGVSDPSNISHCEYFKSCSPTSAEKQALHRRWTIVILPIVENSRFSNLRQQHKRLLREWRSGAGLDDFWRKVEETEIKDALRRNEQKHQLHLEENAVEQLGCAFNHFTKKTKTTYATDFFDPKNPFLVSGTASFAEEDETVEDEVTGTQHLDGSEPTDSDESYQPSRSPTITPVKQRVPWSVLYDTGEGILDYPLSWQTPWVLDDVNVADLLWDFRRSVVARLPSLQAPIEALALNHIYLIRQNDNASSLFSALGSAVWSAVLSNTLQQRIESPILPDVFDAAYNISIMSYIEARDWIMRWQGDLDVKSLLTSMLATSALWDNSHDNEAGLIRKKFDPFFTVFICPIKHLNVFWDMTFPPSKRRKSSDPTLRGQRPDFFACAALPKRQCYLFTVEVKKATQGLVVQSDLEKLASEMRDAMDDLAKQMIDISSGHIYSMTLEANGLYVMRSYTTIYAPRSHKDLGGLALTINAFKNLKADVEESIALCSRPLLPEITPQICKSFGTPVKYKEK
ncbi:hypothetical protein EC968_005320 [Mortierella alpina]|nr:hypothetical protein EC968_005320 [Mortierella alpina]